MHRWDPIRVFSVSYRQFLGNLHQVGDLFRFATTVQQAMGSLIGLIVDNFSRPVYGLG